MNTCYVYVLASRNNRYLSIKSTSDLRHGVRSHRRRISERLRRRKVYQKVVLIESFAGLTRAVERERELTAWPQGRLKAHVTRNNPAWKALSVSAYLARLRAAGERTA